MLESPRMPVNLKIVIGVICFQVISTLFVGLVLLSVVHNQIVAHPGLVEFLAYAALLVAVVLLVCLVFMFGRNTWVRPVIIALEVLNIVSNLIALLLAPQPQLLVSTALSVVVIGTLLRQDVRAWIEYSG